MTEENEALYKVLARIRSRATKTRVLAKTSIIGIIGIAFLIIIFFYFGDRIGSGVEINIKGDNNSESSFIVSSIALNLLSKAALRFGAVFLAIFSVQILVNFTKYNFRIADHLDAAADVLELSQGDIDQIDSIAKLIVPQHIDFAKSPKAPTESVLEIVKTSLSKIPTK